MVDLEQFYGLGLAPVVVALVEILKRWVTDDRWYPVLSLALGVVLNVALAAILAWDLPRAAAIGLLAGLMASGTYSTLRAPLKRTP